MDDPAYSTDVGRTHNRDIAVIWVSCCGDGVIAGSGGLQVAEASKYTPVRTNFCILESTP